MIDRTIVTDRLLLRPFTLADAGFVLDLFGRPEVARWSGDGRPMTGLGEAIGRIRSMGARAGDHAATGVFAVEREGSAVGMAMLVPIPASPGFARRDVEIGWHFLPSAWGNGYATESGRSLAGRAFDAGFAEVVAVTDPQNARSQAVCGRLGMEDLGLRGDWYGRRLRAFRLAAP